MLTRRAVQVTFFLASDVKHSKTRCQDDTVEAGATAAERSWLAAVLTALQNRALPNQRLLSLSLARLENLLAVARQRAGLPPTVTHRLRHGGPTADALNGVVDTVLQRRGRWAALKSVSRYQKPGRYLRKLGKLTAAHKRYRPQAESSPPSPPSSLRLSSASCSYSSALQSI